jgi:hypothetical protein
MSRPPIGRRAAVEMVDLHFLQSIAPDVQPIGFHGLITNPRLLAVRPSAIAIFGHSRASGVTGLWKGQA